MKERLIRATMRFVVRYFYAVLLVAAVAAALCFPRAATLFTTIDTDLTNLLPAHFDSVKAMHELRAKFTSTTSMILVVEEPDQEKARAFVDALDRHLRQDPAISEVESQKRGYAFFDKHKLLFIDLDDLQTIRDRVDRRIQHEKLGGLFIDFEEEEKDGEFSFGDLDEKYKSRYSSSVRSEYYTNDDRTIYSIYLYPAGEQKGIGELRGFYDHVRESVEGFRQAHGAPTTTVYFTGPVRTRVEEYRTLIADLKLAGLISGIGIFLVLLLYFRRAFAAIFVFAPLTAGILVSFALCSFTVGHLNLVTSFLFAILGGLGVEVGIHLLARYIEERRQAGTPPGDARSMEEALVTVMTHTGGSALTSAATVAATFFILVINDFKGFSEFGLIAGVGLVINYCCFILIFPALLVFAEKVRLLAFRRGIGFDRPRFWRSNASTAAAARPSRFPLPRFVLAGLGVLLLITLVDIPQVRFEWRFSRIKAAIPEAQAAKAKQHETSKTVNSPAVVIVHGKAEAQALKAAIEQRIQERGDKSVVDAVRSYYDLAPDDQPEKLGVIAQIRELLADKTLKLVKGEHKKDLDRFKEELAKVEPVVEREIPQKVRELFKGTSGDTTSEIAYINPLPKMEMDDGRNAIAFAEQVQRIETPLGTFHPTSDAIVFADVLRTMIQDGKRVVVLAFLIVFGIVYLDFRKVSDALLVVSPIALGMLYLFLIMYVFDVRLNFYNIIVIPTAVGTSIDNSVHLYHRYRELGRGRLMTALKTSGGAALTSSLTNIFGFLGLVFTSHNGLRSIGELAVAGLMACLLTTLIYFPALLQLLEDRKARA